MYHNWYTGVAMAEVVAAAVLGPAAAPWARRAELLLAVAGPTEAYVMAHAVVPRQQNRGRLIGRRRWTTVGGLSAAAGAAVHTK